MAQRLLDVSTLEPPEPLVLTLSAVAELAAGECLRMRHRRTPCLLYDNLAQRGFSSLTRTGAQGHCEVFIWRDGDAAAEREARVAAEPLGQWRA